MIDYVNSDLFYEDSLHKNFILQFFHIDNGTVVNDEQYTDADLVQESIEVTESICSQSTLMFGGCESNSFKCTLHSIRKSHLNKTFTVYIILNGDIQNPFTLGTYQVKSDKPTADRSGRDIVAYDLLYDLLNSDVSDWWNSLTWTNNTRTIKSLRDDFCNHYGIEQEVVGLPNDNILISKTTKDSLSGKAFLTDICEINACFGIVGRDNKFYYRRLNEIITGLYPNQPLQEIGETGVFSLFPANDVYPKEESIGTVINKSRYFTARYEDYTVNRITKICVWDNNNVKTGEYGSGTNIYNLANNIFTDSLVGTGTSTATNVAQNIYQQVNRVWYMICDVEAMGNPCLEVGDSVRLVTKYDVLYMFIMERHMRGIHGLKDEYTSNGEEYRTDDMISRKPYNSYYNQINTHLNAQSTAIKDLNISLGNLSNIALTTQNITSTASVNALKSALNNVYTTQSWVTQQGYATQGWVNNKGYATESWVSGKGYATEGWVNNKGYATQGWVTDKGYITSSALDGYATQQWVNDKGYLTSGSLSGYATQNWVSNNFYDSVADINDAFRYSAMTPQRVETTGSISCGGNLSVSKINDHNITFIPMGTNYVLGYRSGQ